MIIIKCIILLLTFFVTTFLGLALANRYKSRVKDLKDIRNVLNILGTKIEYTYEPLPQIFSEISNEFNGGIAELFKTANKKMEETSAGEAWRFAIEHSNTNMNNEDLNTLKKLENLLGKTNVEGQLSEIELMKKFIETQIKKAEKERSKNEKLYKNLGVIVGLAIVIILL